MTMTRPNSTAISESFFNQAIRVLDNPNPRVVNGSDEGAAVADMATRLLAQGLVASTVEYVQVKEYYGTEGPLRVGKQTYYNPTARRGAGLTIQSEIAITPKNKRKRSFSADNLDTLEIQLGMYEGALPQPVTLRTQKTSGSARVLKEYIFGSSIAARNDEPRENLFMRWIKLERESRQLFLTDTQEQIYPEEFDLGNAHQLAFWLAGSTIIQPYDITKTSASELRALTS